MNSIFGDVDKSIQEGQARWQQIEELTSSIKAAALDPENEDIISINDIAELVVLLVEHLRPVQPSKEQLDDVMQDITDLLSELGGKKK